MAARVRFGTAYARVAFVWCVVFGVVGIAFAAAPGAVTEALSSLAAGLRLRGTFSGSFGPDASFWHVLAVSLMAAVTGLAWVSARRPEAAAPYRILLAAKLVSTTGFAILAVRLAPAWILAAAGDGFVALTLWASRRGGLAGRQGAGDGREAPTLPKGLARIWPARRPWYEVYFGKLNLAPGRALWFRYTLLDGISEEASCWAVFFDREGKVTAGKEVGDLVDLAPAGVCIPPDASERARFSGKPQVFHLGAAHLDVANAMGRAGAISWDLALSDSGRSCWHVPPELNAAGLVSSGYSVPLADVRFRGTVTVAGATFPVEDAPGMIGHVVGRRSPSRWAWAHCNAFDGQPDVVFEGLAATVALGARTRFLSSFVLWVDGRRVAFASVRVLLATKNEISPERWTFEARQGDRLLSGEALAPKQESVAIVTYTDPDGSLRYCRNSKLATLRIRLVAPGIDRAFTASGTAAFEVVDGQRPLREPDL